ncbi:FadR/GntR family transcriptional regulator [Phytobacter massiliensis]|uniref:Pyruvate dehydrogenase complex repressor n=1 Tax=Phytobacter massiliensis TaxID=1485952 RepID=A0A6N3HB96_9ENTR|nr:FadR/GntR family transcriptional regulator [Phytobacter massiliensis]
MKKHYLHDELLQTLGIKILRGEYPVGSQMPKEQELCEQYAISRTSVRDALLSLRNMGLIVTRTKTGTFVADKTQWKVLDARLLELAGLAEVSLFTLGELEKFRRMIEPNVTALATQAADQNDIQAMQAAVTKMVNNTQDDAIALYNEADLAFHMALILATHNVIFIQLAPMLNMAIKESIQITCPLDSPEERLQSAEMHGQLINAIRERDIELARYITSHMIFNSLRRGLSLEKERRASFIP